MSQKKTEHEKRRLAFDLFGVDLRKVYPLPDDKEFDALLRMLDQLEAKKPKK